MMPRLRSDMYRDQYERLSLLTNGFDASYFTCLLRQDLAYSFKQSVYVLKAVQLLSMRPIGTITKYSSDTSYRFELKLSIKQKMSLEELKTMHVCIYLDQQMLFRGMPHAYNCTAIQDGVEMIVQVGLKMHLIRYNHLLRSLKHQEG